MLPRRRERTSTSSGAGGGTGDCGPDANAYQQERRLARSHPGASHPAQRGFSGRRPDRRCVSYPILIESALSCLGVALSRRIHHAHRPRVQYHRRRAAGRPRPPDGDGLICVRAQGRAQEVQRREQFPIPSPPSSAGQNSRSPSREKAQFLFPSPGTRCSSQCSG